MPLGTGLRLGELLGLNVTDVFAMGDTPRLRIRIRPDIANDGRAANVFLPDRLVTKLTRFWMHKRRRGEGLDAGAPLFCNQARRRISKRMRTSARMMDTLVRGDPNLLIPRCFS